MGFSKNVIIFNQYHYSQQKYDTLELSSAFLDFFRKIEYF